MKVLEKIIAWDLDNTLGDFSSLKYFEDYIISFNKDKKYSIYKKDNFHVNVFEDFMKEYDISFGLAPGIGDFISELDRKGFSQFITTNANNLYAKTVLSFTGMYDFFTDVFSREDVFSESGKRYHCLLEKYGFDMEKARSDMLVFGDSMADFPVDLDGVVFIYNPSAPLIHADLLKLIVKELEDEGKGNFSRGFDVLFGEDNVLNSHYCPIGCSFVNLYRRRSNYGYVPVVQIMGANIRYLKKNDLLFCYKK